MESAQSTLIRNACLLTMVEDRAPVIGDVLIEGAHLAQVGGTYGGTADVSIDAEGAICLPGFVQTHVHLCQAIFRGLADDLSLLDWLCTRIWPLEAAHTAASMRASARLGIAELLLGGTTAFLSMESVAHADESFRAIEELGARGTAGKTHMDAADVPAMLRETTADSLAQAERLCREWHGRADGRVRYAYSPRFAISCTDELLAGAAALAKRDGVTFHTHASENLDECAAVEARTGRRNIAHLDHCACLGPGSVLAHCVHLDDDEIARLARSRTNVAHCPTANLKLASGIADVPRMQDAGIRVALGADGAPCNNALDMFEEMKLAALLHKVRHGPTAMPARRVLAMATIEGARALGIDGDVGTLERGKRADVVLVRPTGPRTEPRDNADPAALLVYAGRAADVCDVWVDGRRVVGDRQLRTASLDEIIGDARREAAGLRERIAERST